MFPTGLIILTFCLSLITCNTVGADISFHLSPIGFAGSESGVALDVFFFLDGFCCGSGKSKSTSAAFLFFTPRDFDRSFS